MSAFRLCSLALLAAAAGSFSACGSTGGGSALSGGGAADSTSGNGIGGGTGEGGGIQLSGGSGGSKGAGGSCADAVVQANATVKPADIIFVVDVSGSMSEEITGLKQNINVNFAQIIGASGIDYRVIMLADHGPGKFEVCIEAPLSTIPKGGCATIGANPPGNNPGKFYQYSMVGRAQSNDALCILLDSLTGVKKDDFNLAPKGWIDWLRPEAFKVIVVISDDRPSCTWTSGKITFNDLSSAAGGQKMAGDFDAALMTLSPTQFGTAMARNYQFHSVNGVQTKNLAHDIVTNQLIAPNAKVLDPYMPMDGVTKDICKTAVAPGTGYQYLSQKTAGLRFPLCELSGYDVIFNTIAKGVVAGAKVPCEFALPKPKDPNQMLDLNTVSLIYTPSMGGGDKELTQVADLAHCTGTTGKFYIDKKKGMIELCPDVCKAVGADDKAKVQVKVECGGGAL